MKIRRKPPIDSSHVHIAEFYLEIQLNYILKCCRLPNNTHQTAIWPLDNPKKARPFNDLINFVLIVLA